MAGSQNLNTSDTAQASSEPIVVCRKCNRVHYMLLIAKYSDIQWSALENVVKCNEGALNIALQCKAQ